MLEPKSYLQSSTGSGASLVDYRRANRQYVMMNEHEVWKFLSSRRKVFAAFQMEDGFPHVSPIWFCVLGKRVYLRTHDYKTKARLARSGKTCLSIDEGDSYRALKGLVLWGRCRLVTDPVLIQRIEQLMDEKYQHIQWSPSEMPAEWVRERKRERRAYIEVVPGRISSWDNSKI